MIHVNEVKLKKPNVYEQIVDNLVKKKDCKHKNTVEATLLDHQTDEVIIQTYCKDCEQFIN